MEVRLLEGILVRLVHLGVGDDSGQGTGKESLNGIEKEKKCTLFFFVRTCLLSVTTYTCSGSCNN